MDEPAAKPWAQADLLSDGRHNSPFLGKMPDFSAGDPAAQLLTLRSIEGDMSDPSWAWLSDAVTAYLDLVETTL
jgi:hypothetical protein